MKFFVPITFLLSSLGYGNIQVVSHWVMSADIPKQTELRPYERTRPVIVGDIIYSASLGGMVTATHRTEGYTFWKAKLEAGVEGGLAYGRSKVFVGDLQGNFYALNARDGSIAWKTKVSAEWLSAPSILRDKVYASSSSGEVYAFQENAGKEVWPSYGQRGDEKMTIRGGGSPVPFGNEVFQGFANGHVVALSAAQGKVIWDKNLRTKDRFYDIDMSPYVDEESVIVGTYDGTLTSLDRVTGERKWVFRVGTYGGVLVEENRVYFSGLNGSFYALEKNSGQPIWKTDFKEGIGLTPVRAGDYLVVTTSSDPVYVLDPANGKVMATVGLGAGSMAAAVGQDGWFYCLSNYGNLYSFEIQKKVASPEPKTLRMLSAIHRNL